MSNMSYCRFQNTLGDLRECKDALTGDDDPPSSEDEREAAADLVRLCAEIIQQFEDSMDDDGKFRNGKLDQAIKNLGAVCDSCERRKPLDEYEVCEELPLKKDRPY